MSILYFSTFIILPGFPHSETYKNLTEMSFNPLHNCFIPLLDLMDIIPFDNMKSPYYNPSCSVIYSKKSNFLSIYHSLRSRC